MGDLSRLKDLLHRLQLPLLFLVLALELLDPLALELDHLRQRRGVR